MKRGEVWGARSGDVRGGPHLVALVQLEGLEVPELPQVPELHAVVVGGGGQVVPWESGPGVRMGQSWG